MLARNSGALAGAWPGSQELVCVSLPNSAFNDTTSWLGICRGGRIYTTGTGKCSRSDSDTLLPHLAPSLTHSRLVNVSVLRMFVFSY